MVKALTFFQRIWVRLLPSPIGVTGCSQEGHPAKIAPVHEKVPFYPWERTSLRIEGQHGVVLNVLVQSDHNRHYHRSPHAVSDHRTEDNRASANRSSVTLVHSPSDTSTEWSNKLLCIICSSVDRQQKAEVQTGPAGCQGGNKSHQSETDWQRTDRRN